MNSLVSLARSSLLAILCGSAIAVLGRAVFTNSSAKASLLQPTKFDFPESIPLSGTKLLGSTSLPAHVFPNGSAATGKSYRYQHLPNPIEAQIRYITDGNINRPAMDAMLPIFSTVPASVLTPKTSEKKSELGFYSLFVKDKTAYFGTCINPRGMTTVTKDQFHDNTNPNLVSNGFPIERLMPWLLGQQTLRDNRCLWTLLSTPIDRATPDDTMKALEVVGINWIRWWQANFPPV